MTNETSAASGSAPAPAAPNHRKDLMEKLDAFDLGARIQNAYSVGEASATPALKEYAEKFIFEREAAQRGETPDEYKARYDAYTDEDREALLLKALPARESLSRDEALKILKENGTLEQILNGSKEDFMNLLDRERTLEELGVIAKQKDDANTLHDINEYGRFVQLGKLIEQMKQYESNLGDPAKAPEYKKKRGKDIILEAPAEYREAIQKSAVRIAVDEARKGLMKGKYSQTTTNALAELDQIVASVDPSYDLIKKAVAQVKKESVEEHKSATGNSNLKERLYTHMQECMRYAISESQNSKLQDHALNLVYAGASKGHRTIGEGKL